ncbi:regulatory-associated protein of TOR 1-like [Cucumis melo]|uniref:Regulatory-associated protein of TOR 1-like n=1 Tax=Cucumis melo TaxID=3656 RepID=A0ABM3KEN6_CUCME|nr:regulatory-associated protein of TOR 1-like [Cucumis melo]
MGELALFSKLVLLICLGAPWSRSFELIFVFGCHTASIFAIASASQVHGGLLAAGFFDGSVKLYDARIPELLVCTMRPHVQKVEKVVGIGFQPGLDSSKIVSASQAGDIQFLDIRNQRDRYLTIDAHRGSLTALAVHRHAPILASGSAKQLIKVFSLDGDQLGTIRYHQQACFHCWWNQT